MSINYRPLPSVSTPDANRFWASVDKRDPNECWPWTAGVNTARDGYGRFWIKRVEYRTNRIAFYLYYGIDPAGQDACHTCDNPPCCNPAHLFKGTRAQNLADMRQKNRQAKGDRHGSRTRPERVAKGTALPHTKLSPDQVLAIRARYAQGGIKQEDLAIEYNVDQGNVSAIILRKSWKHLP